MATGRRAVTVESTDASFVVRYAAGGAGAETANKFVQTDDVGRRSLGTQADVGRVNVATQADPYAPRLELERQRLEEYRKRRHPDAAGDRAPRIARRLEDGSPVTPASDEPSDDAD